MQSSHEDRRQLLVVDAQASTHELVSLPLDDEDTVATWSGDADTRALVITRTSRSGGLSVVRAVARGMDINEVPAHAAVTSIRSELLEAEREVMATPGTQLMALDYPVKRWASGRVFTTQSAACLWLRGEHPPQNVRTSGPNRRCLSATNAPGR